MSDYPFCNYEQQQFMHMLSFTNSETQSLSYTPQLYTDQNITSPNMITDYSQAHDYNNSEIYRAEISWYNTTGLNNYLQSTNINQVEQYDYPATGNNVHSEIYTRPQQSQQSELPITNEMQLKIPLRPTQLPIIFKHIILIIPEVFSNGQ